MLSYRGRFAPSPTGPLHAGSVVAALASWLDARAHGGTWLVRIEDVDLPRCPPGMETLVLHQLAALGLVSDEPVQRQSQRSGAYAQALLHLHQTQQVYPCHCSRQRLQRYWQAHPDQPKIYPGWCRKTPLSPPPPLPATGTGLPQPVVVDGVAWRFIMPQSVIRWHDRRLGPQTQAVANLVGDMVLFRADGLWAYQLAVIIDDHDQGITHVVRGEDLADNTARQIALQTALGLKTPDYWHGPLVCNAEGQKLSKQTGAQAIDTHAPLAALSEAARVLNLPPSVPGASLSEALAQWVAAWADLWVRPAAPVTSRT